MPMRDRLTRFSHAAGAQVPDATAMAVILLVILMLAALGLGNSFSDTSDAFYRGLWMLLAFSMQMTLLLVLSSVLSTMPFFRTAVFRLAKLPGTVTQVFFLSVLLTAALSYLYWGLGLALGPLIAVHFARAAEAKGIRIDFPCLLATQFGAQSIWQYGLSSTPALLVATPGHFLEARTGVMPLETTIWSPAAILFVVTFPLALAALARLMAPGEPRQVSSFPDANALAQAPETVAVATGGPHGLGAWSERTRIFPFLLAVIVAGWLFHHFVTKSANLDLNSMITMLLFVVLLLQRNLAGFSQALRASVQCCWPIVVLYQIYGGIAGVLQYTSVGETLARFFANISTPATFPLLTAIAGTVVAIFVPSSGGQWIIQGFVTSEAAATMGISAQQGLLALGVGDQMGNLISPFWIVVVASLARIDFRTIFGYGLIFAVLWFVLGVGIFTFIPA
ncbi:MAG: short-chain fatty acid transporter [Gammaproteobacteria bacterium]|nr:short-chain fatty acid transporter [Gammaproteobacteria bacterium]